MAWHGTASIQSRQSRLRKRAAWLGVAEEHVVASTLFLSMCCGCKGLSRRNFQLMVKKWTGSSSWDQGGNRKGKELEELECSRSGGMNVSVSLGVALLACCVKGELSENRHIYVAYIISQ